VDTESAPFSGIVSAGVQFSLKKAPGEAGPIYHRTANLIRESGAQHVDRCSFPDKLVFRNVKAAEVACHRLNLRATFAKNELLGLRPSEAVR
jgi:hypothetical protein